MLLIGHLLIVGRNQPLERIMAMRSLGSASRRRELGGSIRRASRAVPFWNELASSVEALTAVSRDIVRLTPGLRTMEPWRLAVGAVAVLLPALLIYILNPSSHVTEPGIVLVVAIAVSAYLADWAGGVTALILTGLALNALFIGDPWRLSQAWTPGEAFALAITLLAGAALIWLIERLKQEGARDRRAAAAARAAAGALAAVEAVAASRAPGDDAGFDRVLSALLTAMVRVNRAHAGSLFLANEDGTELTRVAAYGIEESTAWAQTVIEVGEGFTGRVAQERRPVMIADIREEPWMAESHLVKAGFRAMLGVPLVAAGDRLVGVAYVALLARHRFSQTDAARLEALAHRTVAFLESARAADQRHLLLEQARESQRRLQTIIRAMPEAVIIAVPRDGRIVAYNEAAVRLFGPIEDSDTSLATLSRLLVPATSGESRDDLPLTRAMRTGEVQTGVELAIRRQDGSELPVVASAAPLREPDGAISAVVGVFQDVRPLKEANRLKDEFVSVVSHELRSPLTPIRGFAQLVARELEREGGHESQVAWLQSLEGHVDRMTRLVEDLLDVSRLRAGGLKTHPAPVDVVAICREVIQARQATTSLHEIALEATEQQIVGEWDGDRLHQIIDNLVGNAIKYSPDGGRVSVTLTEDLSAHTTTLVVTDQGPGIPQAERDQLFTAFYRTKGATESRTPGLGLGLFICRELVAAHDGTISVGQAPDGGAAFKVTLPLHSALIAPPAELKTA